MISSKMRIEMTLSSWSNHWSKIAISQSAYGVATPSRLRRRMIVGPIGQQEIAALQPDLPKVMVELDGIGRQVDDRQDSAKQRRSNRWSANTASKRAAHLRIRAAAAVVDPVRIVDRRRPHPEKCQN